MSDAVPFKAAATSSVSSPVQNAPLGAQHRIGNKADDVPPSLYQELEKKPYAVKYLNLELYNDDKDFESIRQQSRELDNYVIQQIKAQGLKDSSESYKEVVDAIFKQIGKSPNEDPTKTLKRLSVGANAISRLESARLQPVLSAKNLTPEEFEGIQ